MTWAFGLPLEPRAKIALLAIADNACDEGIAWPAKDTIAKKSSQSRATVGRRLKSLEALGVLATVARYREDGTQTTDEIRLNLAVTAEDVMRKMHDAGEQNEAETDEDIDGAEPTKEQGGGYQPDTLPSHCGNPTLSDVTGGGYHCGNPQDEPSLEPNDRIGVASARVRSAFTEGSKALASAFWNALGFAGPLDIPPEFAGVDWRAIQWETAGWTVDLIDAEARRIAATKPLKPISYFEKVFATAFAKRQAPLPVVKPQDAPHVQADQRTRSESLGAVADRLANAGIGFGPRPTGLRDPEGRPPAESVSQG